jgi:hypothetical protein
MNDDRLPELLSQAVPPLGPALSADDVLAKAKRRQNLRRSGAVASVALLAVLGSVGLVSLRDNGSSTNVPPVVGTSSCPSPSPYASTDGEPTVTIPASGSTPVTIATGGHVTVGWSRCGEDGTITSDDDGSILRVTDVSSTGKGGPVFDVRYEGVSAGTVTLAGDGSLGSHGTVVVTVQGSSATPTPVLVPPDLGGPAAGACGDVSTDVVTVLLNPDVPSPRCTTVHVGQKLRITNATGSFGAVGKVVTITLKGFAPVTLQVGESYTFPKPLSDVLAPGYHRTSGGPYGDPELLVDGQ